MHPISRKATGIPNAITMLTIHPENKLELLMTSNGNQNVFRKLPGNSIVNKDHWNRAVNSLNNRKSAVTSTPPGCEEAVKIFRVFRETAEQSLTLSFWVTLNVVAIPVPLNIPLLGQFYLVYSRVLVMSPLFPPLCLFLLSLAFLLF